MDEKYVDPKTGKTYRKKIRKIQHVDGSVTFKEEVVPEDIYTCENPYNVSYSIPYDEYDNIDESDMIPKLPSDMEYLSIEKQVEILRMHYRMVCDMFNQLVGIVNGLQRNTQASFDFNQKEIQEFEHHMNYLAGEMYNIRLEQQSHSKAWHSLLIPAKEDKDENNIS